MRKHLLILVLSVVFQSVCAQDNTPKKLRIGLKAGASFSNLLFAEEPYSFPRICAGGCPPSEDTFNYQVHPWNSHRTAITLGAIAELYLKRKNRFIAELNYEQKGLRLEYAASEVEFVQTPSSESVVATYRYMRRDIRNNYLTVSTLFKTGLGKKGRIFLVNGLYTGYLFSSSNSGRDVELIQTYYSPNWTVPSTGSQTVSDYNTNDARQQTTRFDLGLATGGGWEFSLSGDLSVALEMRFNIGFLKIGALHEDQFNFSGSYVGLNSDARNMNLNVTVCLFYSL